MNGIHRTNHREYFLGILIVSCLKGLDLDST